MFSLFKRRPPENYEDITLGVDDTVELPQGWHEHIRAEFVSQSPAAPNKQTIERSERETDEDPLAAASAQRAIEDINAEEIRRGKPYTTEERRDLLLATAKKYVYEALARKGMADLVHDLNDTISNQMDGLDERLHEISAKLDEPRDAIGRALKFQQEHPFLAGFLGADIAHRQGKK